MTVGKLIEHLRGYDPSKTVETHKDYREEQEGWLANWGEVKGVYESGATGHARIVTWEEDK
jgi:hypothetical protein